MDRLTIQQLDRIEAKLNTILAIEGIELDKHGFPILTQEMLDEMHNEDTNEEELLGSYKEDKKEKEEPKKKVQRQEQEE